jgi:hypothetical protein
MKRKSERAAAGRQSEPWHAVSIVCPEGSCAAAITYLEKRFLSGKHPACRCRSVARRSRANVLTGTSTIVGSSRGARAKQAALRVPPRKWCNDVSNLGGVRQTIKIAACAAVSFNDRARLRSEVGADHGQIPPDRALWGVFPMEPGDAPKRLHSVIRLFGIRMFAMTASYTRSIALTVLLSCLVVGPVFALGLNDLTNQDAARGIKGALTEGAASAIAKLGVPGGFLNNPKVKIPLPPALDELAKGMRMMGRGKDADELVATMNQAAEQAVPEAKALMLNAVKTMSVEDAKKILTGGDDSVTQFFRAKTAAPLAVKFLPIVKRATDRVGLAQKYNQFAGEGAKLGLIKGDAANIETYVTEKALDGLYLMIGEEEHAIRQNPAAAGSAIVSKVFGALRS